MVTVSAAVGAVSRPVARIAQQAEADQLSAVQSVRRACDAGTRDLVWVVAVTAPETLPGGITLHAVGIGTRLADSSRVVDGEPVLYVAASRDTHTVRSDLRKPFLAEVAPVVAGTRAPETFGRAESAGVGREVEVLVFPTEAVVGDGDILVVQVGAESRGDAGLR